MSLIEWNQKFSIGIQEIDNQHKRLIELINLLHDCRMKGGSIKCIGKIMISIEDYIRTHFSSEETLMKRVNYPQFDEHHLKHVQIIKDFAKFKQRLTGDSPPTALELFIFLKQWLTNHIVENDKPIGKYIAGEVAKQEVK